MTVKMTVKIGHENDCENGCENRMVFTVKTLLLLHLGISCCENGCENLVYPPLEITRIVNLPNNPAKKRLFRTYCSCEIKKEYSTLFFLEQ